MDKNNPNEGGLDPQKPKKVSNIPASRFSLAQTAIKVAACWAAEFPSLQVPNEDQQLLAQRAADMNGLLAESKVLESKQKQNSNDMNLHNKDIDKAVTYLKKSVKFVHYQQTNLAPYYMSYGLMLVNKGNYSLPRDNDERAAALLQLLGKLQEPNNPIALHPHGLREWTQLQTKHHQLWVDSEAIRRRRSAVSSAIDVLYGQVKSSLRQIHKYMGFLYKGDELKKQRRVMGFLKESF